MNMDTPTTPAGLRQFDDRAPVDAVIAAWTQPGPRPDHHARAQAEDAQDDAGAGPRTRPAHRAAAVSADLVTWLRAQLDEDEQVARHCAPGPWSTSGPPRETYVDSSGVSVAVGWQRDLVHVARWDPARVLAEVDAKRRIIDEHQPKWRTVEWPHDQNGKGEAQVCRRCENANHSTWNPPVGEAGVLPEGFIVPYVLAPCPTLRLLALPYADRPGYRDEWRPE